MITKMNSNIKNIIANNLVYLMKVHDVSRKDICEALDIKYTTLCDWINARTYPRLDALEVVADYFNVEMKDMFIEIEKNDEASSRIESYAKRLNFKTDYKRNYKL